MDPHQVGGGVGSGVEIEVIMNVVGDTYSTAMRFGELYSYQVLESHFKCNQGTESVTLSASIPVHTCKYPLNVLGHFNH